MTTAFGPVAMAGSTDGADPARAGLRQALADPLRAQALHRAARAVRHDDELVALGAPAGGDHGPELG